LTGLARDGSPATVFGGKMGASPPMSARRNANNLSSLSRGMNNNNRVRPPLFSNTGVDVTANVGEGANQNNIGATIKQEEKEKDPYDEKEANEARDSSTKLLAEIAEYLESTKTEEEIEREERRKEAASGRKRKTPVKKSSATAKKEGEENNDENAMMMSTPPPSSSRKASNAAATTTPNTNATPLQIKGGLKSFAMKVCEKVKERGTTTYDDVSDALVADVLAEREKEGIPLSLGSNRKKVNTKKEEKDGNENEGILEGDGLSSPKRRNKVEVKEETNDDDDKDDDGGKVKQQQKKKTPSKSEATTTTTTTPQGTKEKKKSKRANETVDEKNIRRRVYDALNVLIAINVVSRDKNEDKKKTITWRGIGEEFGDASLFGDLAAPPRDKSAKQSYDAKREEEDLLMKKKKKKEEEEQKMKEEELSTEEQEAIEKENRETRERIRKKALYLSELTEQFDALLSLVQRNQRNEMEAQKKMATVKKEPPAIKTDATTKKGGGSATAKKKIATESAKKGEKENMAITTTTVAEDDNNVPSAPDGIQLPFILVQTDQKATVEVEISEDQRVVHFDFNESPFQVFDGNYVLKHTEGIKEEMAKMKKERMQRLGVKNYDESIFRSPEEGEEEDKEEAHATMTTPKKAKKTKKTP
jgi:hypothetical protein